MREFVRAILRKRPLIAVLVPLASDAPNSCTEAECREILASDESTGLVEKLRPQVEQWAAEWAQPDLQLPTAQEAAEALFASTSLVWSQLAAERDVTMRMIGERLIVSFQHAHGGEYKQLAYVKDEVIAED